MIGNKTSRQIKSEIRTAFADKGIDVETWLDRQMAKLQKAPVRDDGVLESLKLIAEGLSAKVAKRKTVSASAMARSSQRRN
jgi:hypothetical protein